MNMQSMINEYAEWLKQEISFSKIDDYFEITTPYLNSANDYLQFYVKLDGKNVFFTDDGDTIRNLEMAGFQFSAARKEHLNQILNQYGIQLNDKELTAKSTIEEFPQKKHLFVQAMLRVDDMFAISKSKVTSYFLDDIQSFFDSHEIYYTENVQFTGTSGFTHNYDFILQRSKTQPERLCQAINNPTKSNMMNVLFAWNDTKAVRKSDSKLIVFLNDENTIAKGIVEGFNNYNAHVIRWSDRENDNNIKILSA